ncbi:MAG: hypothetical protein ACXW3Z_17090, partial [Limisphaerales bacterium]
SRFIWFSAFFYLPETLTETGIPSSLAIFSYQPAKPPAVFQSRAIFTGFKAAVAISLEDANLSYLMKMGRFQEGIPTDDESSFSPYSSHPLYLAFVRCAHPCGTRRN